MLPAAYLCRMSSIEEILQTNKFRDERHKATLNLLYSAYWLKTHFSSVAKENGITVEQFNVLRILKGKHPEAMCVKDIASRMIEKSSNVPRIIDRLFAKELVERYTSKEDKRETLIAITDKGIEQLTQLNVAIEQINDTILGLSEEEATLLNSLLDKMRLVG